MKLALTFSDALHVHATESARVTIYILLRLVYITGVQVKPGSDIIMRHSWLC